MTTYDKAEFERAVERLAFCLRVLFPALFLWFGCSDPPTAAELKAAPTVTAQQIANAYIVNEVAADAKFGDKWFTVDARASVIEQHVTGPTVTSNLAGGLLAILYFSHNDDDWVATVKRGETVEVKCHNVGSLLPKVVTMECL